LLRDVRVGVVDAQDLLPIGEGVSLTGRGGLTEVVLGGVLEGEMGAYLG
jgi:hypothetical protein